MTSANTAERFVVTGSKVPATSTLNPPLQLLAPVFIFFFPRFARHFLQDFRPFCPLAFEFFLPILFLAFHFTAFRKRFGVRSFFRWGVFAPFFSLAFSGSLRGPRFLLARARFARVLFVGRDRGLRLWLTVYDGDVPRAATVRSATTGDS